MYPTGYYHGMVGKSFCFLPPTSTFRAFALGQPQRICQHGTSPTSLAQFSTLFPFDTRMTLSRNNIFDPVRTKLSDTCTIKEIGNFDQDGGTTKIGFPTRFDSNSDSTVMGSPSSSNETKKSFACPQCKYSTDRKNNLKRHVITMHFDCDRKLECCGTVFRSKAKLREHVTLFHKNGYRCLVCARMFCRKALLRRHMAVHSGKKDFHCDFCSYATSHKSNLERHQKVHAKASASRFVYSPRKLEATFERKLYAIENTHDARSIDDISQYKPAEEEDHEKDNFASDIKMETSEMAITSEINLCKDNNNDIKDALDTQETTEDVKIDDNSVRSTSEAISTEQNDRYCSYLDKSNTCHFVLGIPGHSASENNMDTFSNGFPYKFIQNGHFRREREFEIFKESLMCSYEISENNSEGDEHDILIKENVDMSNTDSQENNDNYNDTAKKCSLRLCGLPYRCSSCGSRFTSQDKLANHACANGGVDKFKMAQNSVSLVALILKQGNRIVSF